MQPDYDTEKFYLGTLCKYGHNYEGTKESLRRINDRGCLKCARARGRKYDQEHKEQRNAKSGMRARAYYYKNRGRISAKRKTEEFREKARGRAKIYYTNNTARYREYGRKNRMMRKAIIPEENRRYREANKESIAKQKAEYYQRNKGSINAHTRQHRKDNLEAIRERERGYHAKKDKDKLRAHNRKYYYEQRENNTPIAIKQRLRSLVRTGMKKYSGKGKIAPSIKYGIDYAAIVDRLGPHPNTRGIKGVFHMDHIIPLAAFDLNDPGQIKLAFAPGNHQWLLAKENRKKHNHIEGQLNLMTQKQLQVAVNATD